MPASKCPPRGIMPVYVHFQGEGIPDRSNNDMDNHSKHERITALVEVIAVVAIAFLSKAALDSFTWRFSGPVSLITLVILLTVYLRRRGLYWSGMGLLRSRGRSANGSWCRRPCWASSPSSPQAL
tara:strand:- start:449 stop:823 length:375 start_codon:yes stop_codon:yes gene_type:complete